MGIAGERVPPYNHQAEESLIGAALLSPAALAVAIEQLEPGDFYLPSCQVIHVAMRKLWAEGHRAADAVLVAEQLTQQGDLDIVGGAGVLITMQSNTPATSNAGRYAHIIQEKSLYRRMVQTGDEIRTMGYDDKGEDSIGVRLARARQLVNDLEMPIGAVEESPTIDKFLERETTMDWLVPGLIERGDRIILTAAEGRGKSTLIRQLAVQMASGIHPWENRFTDPINVLIVDVENSIPQVQRKLKQLQIVAGKHLDPKRLRVEVHTAGLDLANRHDARWLNERVASARPDLVTIGPVYKLHTSDPKEEQPARQVAQVLDDLRNRYGVSLLIEAHSPHGSGSKRDLRPFGASLWMRWPEFGYGLRETKADPTKYKVEPWRGPRDVRSWPTEIRRGGEWPWTATPEQQRVF